MRELAKAIRESSRLSKLGQLSEALDYIDRSISEAIRGNHGDWVQILCRHAAIISNFAGDLNRAKRYNEEALSYGPENRMALFGLAKVLVQLGQPDLAKQYATKCYELAIRDRTKPDRAMLELLGNRWPELGRIE
jgi:tetratricopeptide (TPR) repeat protein